VQARRRQAPDCVHDFAAVHRKSPRAVDPNTGGSVAQSEAMAERQQKQRQAEVDAREGKYFCFSKKLYVTEMPK